MPAQSQTTSTVGSNTRRTIAVRGHRLGLPSNRRRIINFLHGMPFLEKCFHCPYSYAMVITYYSLLQSFYSFLTCLFNLYHSRTKILILYSERSLWFLDIYTTHVTTFLVLCTVVLMVLSIIVVGTSIMLIPALQNDQCKGIVKWLYSFAAFLVCRYFVWWMSEFTNYVYDLVLPVTGAVMAVLNVYTWILMFSYHFEISQKIQFKKLKHVNMRAKA